MKKIHVIICVFVVSSCQIKPKPSKLTKANNGIESKDCPVPQKGQNDTFLKGINSLKNYKWNAITKQAVVKTKTHGKIIITHGGCIHFIVDAEFYPKQKIDVNNDMNHIFDEILWLTKLLKDFNFFHLKTALQTKDYNVFNNQYVTTITFNTTFLKEKNYAIVINTKENTFSISQFLQ